MRSPGARRPRGPGVIRRRVRQPTVIELPLLREAPPPPHPGRHAQVFVLALAAIVLAGTVLLASPWTTESGAATPPVDALFTAVSAVAAGALATGAGVGAVDSVAIAPQPAALTMIASSESQGQPWPGLAKNVAQFSCAKARAGASLAE